MVQGYNMVQRKYPQLLKRMQESTAIVEMTHIPFFRGVQQGVFDAEMKSYHPITKINALNKHYKELHINYNGVLQKDGKQKLTINSTGHPLDPVKLVKLIMKQIGMYSHKFEVGDVVIWDNNQVMHQSTGYFKGNRSILRIQTNLIKEAQFIRNLVDKEVYGAK